MRVSPGVSTPGQRTEEDSGYRLQWAAFGQFTYRLSRLSQLLVCTQGPDIPLLATIILFLYIFLNICIYLIHREHTFYFVAERMVEDPV